MKNPGVYPCLFLLVPVITLLSCATLPKEVTYDYLIGSWKIMESNDLTSPDYLWIFYPDGTRDSVDVNGNILNTAELTDYRDNSFAATSITYPAHPEYIGVKGKYIIERLDTDTLKMVLFYGDEQAHSVNIYRLEGVQLEEYLGARKSSRPDAYKPSIAILEFGVEGVSKAQGKLVVDILNSVLEATGRFTVIERKKMEELQGDQNLSSNDEAIIQNQLEAGKLAAADFVITGRIEKIGKRYLLDVKILEAATGTTFSTASRVFTSLNSLLDNGELIACLLINY
ncbi:MAG: hypothetical protein JW969_10405 [Spirochaetales bacterium]|nr:hypothetical protein [Spirochaetales bacterium]